MEKKQMPRENEVEVAAQEVIAETQFPGALREARRFNPLIWQIRIILLNGEIFEISVANGPIEDIKSPGASGADGEALRVDTRFSR